MIPCRSEDADSAELDALADEYAAMIVEKWQRMGHPIAPLGGSLIAQAVLIWGQLGASREDIAAGLRDMADGAESAVPPSTH